jgi:hypothetical protein
MKRLKYILSALLLCAVATWAATYTIGTDAFMRPNNPIEGTGLWTLPSSAPCGLVINNNKAITSGSPPLSSCHEFYNATWPNDQWSGVTLAGDQDNSSQFDYAFIALRQSATAETYYAFYYPIANLLGHPATVIISYVAGASAQLATGTTPFLNVGDSVFAYAQGTTLTLYYCASPCSSPPGVQELQTTDSSIASGGAGFGIFNNMDGEVEITPWIGGGFTSSSGPPPGNPIILGNISPPVGAVKSSSKTGETLAVGR